MKCTYDMNLNRCKEAFDKIQQTFMIKKKKNKTYPESGHIGNIPQRNIGNI